MTIINVCHLFAPIVGPLIGIINILIFLYVIENGWIMTYILTSYIKYVYIPVDG